MTTDEVDPLDPVRNNFPKPIPTFCRVCHKHIGGPEFAGGTTLTFGECKEHCAHRRRMVRRADGKVHCGNRYCGIELAPCAHKHTVGHSDERGDVYRVVCNDCGGWWPYESPEAARRRIEAEQAAEQEAQRKMEWLQELARRTHEEYLANQRKR